MATPHTEVLGLGDRPMEKDAREEQMEQRAPGVLGAVISVFYFFLPPPPGASEKKVRRWQHRVSISLAAIIIILLLFIAATLGSFPPYWMGFARASTLVKDEDQWRLVRLEILDTKLFDTRGRQCAAIVNRNQDALRSETERLQEKLVEYQLLNRGTSWRTPDCNEY